MLEGPKGETSIAVKHGIPERAHVKVTILDILGQQVRTLVDETQDAGYFEVTWDGANAGDKPVATGIFSDRIQAGDYVAIREQFNERSRHGLHRG